MTAALAGLVAVLGLSGYTVWLCNRLARRRNLAHSSWSECPLVPDPVVVEEAAAKCLDAGTATFEPSAQAIHNWVKRADPDEGKRKDGLTTLEREELARLRRENKQLRLEREILSKAAAWFAGETRSIPQTGGTPRADLVSNTM